MAIELPRASAGTVGTGRARRPARLPTAGDVPTQEIARDPGVNIPDLGAVGRGLQDLGAGVTDVGESLRRREDRLAQADARLNSRRESVERMRAGRELSDFGNQLFTEFESSRDLGRREDAEEFGAAVNAKAAELIANHQGSEESKLRLEEKLGAILQTASDRAGVASVKAQDALVDREFDEAINELSARVRTGDDPRALIAEGEAFLEAEKDALRPGQEIAFSRDLSARVWGAKIDDFLSKGALDEVEEMLQQPEVRAAIGATDQRRAFDRITAARREGKTRILTPTQMAVMGFPPDTIAAGLVVQEKADGSVNVVFNPPRDRDENVRTEKIKAIAEQREALGDSPEDALNFATGLVDGNIRIEIVPGLGVARAIDEITGEVSEIPLGQQIAPPEPVQEETLFQVIERGNTAGIFPAAKELIGRTVGQAFEGAIDPQLVQDRQTIRTELRGLIRALSINPRFPVGEMEKLEKEISIGPAAFDSPGSLIARAKSIRRSLDIRLRNEQTAAADPNLPQNTRAAAAQAAKDIGNFLNRLGTPTTDQPTRPSVPADVPEGSTRTGTTRDGAEVWTDPTGKQWVVE